MSVTPPEQGDTSLTSPRQRYSPPRQEEHGKLKITSLPKLEENTNTGAVSPMKELAGKMYIIIYGLMYLISISILVSTPPGKAEASQPVESNDSQPPVRAISS